MAVQEKTNLKKTLPISEEQLQLMIEAVVDYGIFLLDPEGYVVSWNEGAERIKGYTANEIIGQHFSVFYPEEALKRNWPAHELEVARKEGRFEDEGWRVRKDGTQFWANVVITALRDEHGKPVGFTKVTRDLTERMRHEQALEESQARLERANRELEEKNRELQEFAYAASHDLQEPLRKINTFADLLEAECREQIGEGGRLYLERMRVSAKRMSALINELLSYSRVTTRPRPFVDVDLNSTIDDMTRDLQLSLEETGGRIDHEALPCIEADASQMRQLFQNLLENSLKYHRPGVPPVVHISYGKPPAANGPGDPEMCSITVADNGIGFDQRYADRIFAPFYRLHTRREYEGTGLGLAICRRIVERHGGSITATGSPGEGARFTVSLPARQRAVPASPQMPD